MGLFRVDRRRRERDPYLMPKVMLFMAGALAAIAGMWTRQEWPVTLAIALLALGLVLRLLPRDRPPPAP